MTPGLVLFLLRVVLAILLYGFLAALVWTWHLWGQVVGHGPLPHPGAVTAVSGALAIDGFSLFVTMTVCVGLILGALLAEHYLPQERLEGPDGADVPEERDGLDSDRRPIDQARSRLHLRPGCAWSGNPLRVSRSRSSHDL